jgi:hypothetical protein
MPVQTAAWPPSLNILSTFSRKWLDKLKLAVIYNKHFSERAGRCGSNDTHIGGRSPVELSLAGDMNP